MDARPDGAQVNSVSLRSPVASRLGTLRLGARVGRKADSIHLEPGHNISAWCDASVGSETSEQGKFANSAPALTNEGRYADWSSCKPAPLVRRRFHFPDLSKASKPELNAQSSVNNSYANRRTHKLHSQKVRCRGLVRVQSNDGARPVRLPITRTSSRVPTRADPEQSAIQI